VVSASATESRVRPMAVADVVGATLAAHGVDLVFGVIGSGNFVVTNALCARGARFVAARHESGAVSMADGWARTSGRPGVASVHQGPGLTNAMTALAEAAKSATPLLLLAGDTPAAALGSNFRVDQHDLVTSVGAIAERIHDPATAAHDAARALHRAAAERRPVVLMLPIDVQAAPAPQDASIPPRAPLPHPPAPAADAVRAAAELIARSRRPVIVAGRGAVVADARDAAETLGARCGALLASSAPAKGLFAGLPYDVGISGGFASPTAATLLEHADLVLALGARLNPWTTRHGRLFGDATVIKVDADPSALGQHLPADLAIVGDAALTAGALAEAVPRQEGWRTPDVAARIAAGRWRDVPFADEPADGTVDPRALSIALNELLPDDVAVATDSGAFLGWPAFYLDVPDARSWAFTNGFQAIGLGLATAIGVAVAAPDRITVAAVGDGGLFMALAELETAARLGLPLLVLVYDDAAYGAEVHHFGPDGHDLDIVRFPDADLAAIARAAGCEAVTARSLDLEPVAAWLRDPRGPIVVDAKVDPRIYGEWLADAFRGG
jgi:thiamine pyrophosphate-dependent acetolactate synthase large subunit-like protein